MPRFPTTSSPSDSASTKLGSTSKTVALLAAYETGQKLWNQADGWYQRHFSFWVSVSETDPLYADIYEWLLSIMPDEKHHSLSISTPGHFRRRRRYDAAEDVPEGSNDGKPVAPPPLVVRFDDKASRKIMIGGHRIIVRRVEPDKASGIAELNFSREPEPPRIQFKCPSYAAQQAVVAELNRINDSRKTTRMAVLRMLNSWGSWRVRSDLPPRTLDSVALPAAQKAQIVADLGKFLEDEEKYNHLALPWHRGYMFKGPPGTGKTSLVKALACHYNLDLWYISLADLKTETSLLSLLADVTPRSILLLEDIDSMKITNEDNTSEPGTISISSLLNTLDGVATPHGLITMMTTNNFDRLDKRLIRNGRMDVIEELDWPSSETIADLYNHFYGRQPEWHHLATDVPLVGLSAAQVSEIFKRYLDDPEGAEEISKVMIVEKSVSDWQH